MRNPKKWLQQTAGVTLILLLLAGCGGTAAIEPEPTARFLSDEEFVIAAQGTCEALAAELASLEELDFSGRAEAYHRAAGTLAALEISEESAPQGTLLRTSLAELAGAFETFSGALDQALAEAGIDKPAILMWSEDGDVYASAGSIFDMVKLEIDNAVVTRLTTGVDTAREAANALGLEECAPEPLGDGE